MAYGFNNDKSKLNMSDLLKVDSQVYSESKYVAAGDSISIMIEADTIPGYEPIGVLTINNTSSDFGLIGYTFGVNNGYVHMSLFNRTSSGANLRTIIINVLYRKKEE